MLAVFTLKDASTRASFPKQADRLDALFQGLEVEISYHPDNRVTIDLAGIFAVIYFFSNGIRIS